MYAGDEFYGDEITSPTMRPNTLRPLAREDEHPVSNTYTIKVLGTQYIVLKNGRWITPSATVQAFGTRESAEAFIKVLSHAE